MDKSFNHDIQGLRALAVLAVVLFHINPKILPGGYLGVDIFFVISGYLIIGHIWSELENNKFNLMNFYVKRTKRLFPALFVMIIASVVIGYFILLPSETTDMHKSLISSLFYVSNFYFYNVTDYFNTNIHYAPMLHTWSLSVEEQFYIIFPLILIFLYQYPKKILFFLFTLFILFFIISITLVNIDQSLAFYSSPSRFFQFLAGGILSVSNIKNIFSKKTNELAAFFGLVIITITFFLYSENTSFPGINALLPTIATLMIIFSSKKSIYTNKILTNKIAQFLGNSSYSIYLWHWPLIVYWKIYKGELSKTDQLLILALSIIIGFLSWKYIENKTRFAEYRINPILLSLSISLIFTFLIIFTLDGMSFRYNDNQVKIANYLNYKELDYREGKCFFTKNKNDISLFDEKECIKYKKEKQNILLIGDSHAAMFYTTLNTHLEDGQTLSQITASGCRPLTSLRGDKECTNLISYAFKDIIKNYKFDIIILAGRWQKEEFNDIKETLDYVKNYSKEIFLIGRNIDFDNSLPRILISSKSDFLNSNKIIKFKEVNEIDTKLNDLIEKEFENITYISMFTPFCNEKGCNLTLNNEPIIYDTNHLTLKAANYIYNQAISNKIKEIK